MRVYKYRNLFYIEHIKVDEGKIVLPQKLQEKLNSEEVNIIIITKN